MLLMTINMKMWHRTKFYVENLFSWQH